MKTNKTPRAIVPGDVQYSKLSHTLKFTVSISEKMIMLLEDITGNNMLSPEEAALVLCDLAENAVRDTTALVATHDPDQATLGCVFGEEES